MRGEEMEHVAAEFSTADQGTAEHAARYRLSEKGYAYLEEYHFLWSMLLDDGGNVVWSWRLPEELPRSYGLADVAKFSRWYLMDYPVRVWEMDGMLLVSGYGKDHAVKINLMYPLWQIQSFPRYLSIAVGMNVVLFLFMTYYFVRKYRYSFYYLTVLFGLFWFGLGGFAGLNAPDGLLLCSLAFRLSCWIIKIESNL